MRGGISASNVIITLRVSILGFRALGSSTFHTDSIAMREKSGQKTAIIVGMLIEFIDLLAVDLETDEAFYQAPVLAE